REVRPGRLEGVYAFRPRAHQDCVGTGLAALGGAGRQSINLCCLWGNQGGHGQTFFGADSSPLVWPFSDDCWLSPLLWVLNRLQKRQLKGGWGVPLLWQFGCIRHECIAAMF